ncbi:hypothetical protein F8O06_05255 [Pseudoclavibacter sp. CFCC 14310]|uniref:hypothetical protein n=1 Tax=Pseudoclavibacter sp. CFCC 14310 TaxID=2615180 RepID=UPI0013013409|nr:hypothetical protein [Pseudoclavibacter sp. CFCC 14310]KAB1646173.1 hypothetical protein F8O06_05255 [Pseudoclavibacter sp. CFCC 14310]
MDIIGYGDLPIVTDAASNINLQSKWGTFWGSVSSALSGVSGVMTMITIVGFIMIVLSLGKFLYEKRKSQGAGGIAGQQAKPIWWALALGGLLIAPEVLVPIFLGVFDILINLVINLGNSAGIW